MDSEKIELVEPSLEYQDGFQALAREYLAVGGQNPHRQPRYEEAVRDFPSYVSRLRNQARGLELPPGFVPCSTYWLVRDGKTVVAESNLRHRLTPQLEQVGGHIGYGVRPSERRKGYGTILCTLTLQRARALGLTRVLITCDSDNIGSARIIEKNGGKLENQVAMDETGKLKNRYWVEL